MTRCSRACVVRCVWCGSRYLLPTSAPQRTKFEAQRALTWLDEHECGKAEALPL